MGKTGYTGCNIGKRRKSRDPCSSWIFLWQLLIYLVAFTFYHSISSKACFSSCCFPGKASALLSLWSWGTPFTTKPSPLLTAAAAPTWNRTPPLLVCLTMAEAQVAPALHLPSVDLWPAPSITLQLSLSAWWGQWIPWSQCSSPSITVCSCIPHPSTAWKPSRSWKR